MNRKLRHYYFGLWAEALCRFSLRLRGYRIRASRWRTALGEIDLVASRGKVLAVIEVKARRDDVAAANALNAVQRGRIERASQLALSRWPQFQRGTVRFDVMLVTPWHWPRHIVNAWGES